MNQTFEFTNSSEVKIVNHTASNYSNNLYHQLSNSSTQDMEISLDLNTKSRTMLNSDINLKTTLESNRNNDVEVIPFRDCIENETLVQENPIFSANREFNSENNKLDSCAGNRKNEPKFTENIKKFFLSDKKTPAISFPMGNLVKTNEETPPKKKSLKNKKGSDFINGKKKTLKDICNVKTCLEKNENNSLPDSDEVLEEKENINDGNVKESRVYPKKRLRTIREINKEKNELKKFKKKLAEEMFLENEAELGSDNEENDDIVKVMKQEDKEEENESETEPNIEGLIEDDNNLEVNERKLRGKFYEDMLKDDKEIIKQIIKGPIRRESSYADYYEKYDPLSVFDNNDEDEDNNDQDDDG